MFVFHVHQIRLQIIGASMARIGRNGQDVCDVVLRLHLLSQPDVHGVGATLAVAHRDDGGSGRHSGLLKNL